MSEEQKQPIGAIAQCWGCEKVYNISLLPPNTKNVRCPKCGGVVVSETGSARMKFIYSEWEGYYPLLEEGDWADSVSGDKHSMIKENE